MLTDTETWRPVPGYEGLYEVSDQGRVRSLVKWRGGTGPRLLTGSIHRDGHRMVTLHRRGDVRTAWVHHLVAAAFLGPRPVGTETRHLDGNPANNSVVNLAYGSKSENAHDAVRHGTHSQASKTHCPQGHEYTPDNTCLRQDVTRVNRKCRTCERLRARRRHAARKALASA